MLRIIVAMLVAATTLAGCSAPPAIGEIMFTATDYAFAGPATAPAGWTRILFDNGGQDLHHITLLRLEGDHRAGDLQAYLLAERKVPDWAKQAGGPNAFDPGNGGSATVLLREGHYALICFIPDREGVPHFALGMAADLEVVPRASQPDPPREDASFVLRDFSFDVPALGTGERLFRVDNPGGQAHELTLIELLGDAGIPDLLASFSPNATGPPPASFVGGVTGMEAGDVNYFVANLKAGRYALICFVEDPNTGAPHFALGMAQEVSI